MKYFNKNEFAEFNKMDSEFLKFLDELRERYKKPIIINSSYRNPNYNEKVGGVKSSAHTEIPCKAVDVKCVKSKDRMKLIEIALKLNCRRIGIGKNFLHFDFSKRVNNVIWTYYEDS